MPWCITVVEREGERDRETETESVWCAVVMEAGCLLLDLFNAECVFFLSRRGVSGNRDPKGGGGGGGGGYC